ncbi:PREDICTED: UDP-glycosyltransferase 90A1 [Ipomoea nil]|uniref:UDP-glycosyltransferase 90A1 n=1 Tax=Ipomoea nil TaxID=35883 RepID=UPI0009012D08|nr:PREDICTED: UDP-glycosyltransferase 90A1 [Ipomoea nil]
MMSSHHNPHVVLFPFMSKGHTIPLLQLARLLLLRRGVALTIFTTPANRPFFSKSLSDVVDAISLIDLPFPENIPGVPPGIESTDKLPSMSLFPAFAAATKLMKPHFERALNALPPVSFMITDGFLGWTLDSANNLGIPRLVYFGMSYFSSVVSRSVTSAGLILKPNGDDEAFTVPDFPWLSVTRNDFDAPFRDREPKGPLFDFVTEQMVATVNSHGLVMNSFCDLEHVYMEFYNRNLVPKSWPVGPFCLAEPRRKPPPENQEKPSYIKWLDGFHEQGKQVLYVAFGSQAEISPEQLREIKVGLEESEVNFLWVVRTHESELDGFEDRVKNRGLLVREWVDQREILGHPSVNGFVSHCGWNSVLESICAAVPIAAWPMMAEQHLNARMVVEEMKIGVRVESCNGSVRGFVKSESVEKAVRELMEGEIGKSARKKVKELSNSAINAIKEGGSSWLKLDELINEFHAKMKKNPDM